jgi:hypothetical protein
MLFESDLALHPAFLPPFRLVLIRPPIMLGLPPFGGASGFRIIRERLRKSE